MGHEQSGHEQASQYPSRINQAVEQVADLSDAEIESIMLAHPFEKFERRKFVRRLKELTLLKFDPALWRSLTDTDKAHLKHLAETALIEYYQRLKAP